MEIEIIKVAKWTWNNDDLEATSIKPISDMSEEEKEDEVVRRLKEPPRKESIENLIFNAMAAAITNEIDMDILDKLKKDNGV